jgi:hypothetical protein
MDIYPLNPETAEALQKFQTRLNAQPHELAVESTPDNKAKTVVISHIEMTLDEMFFGQWSTLNFKWAAIANEVQGSLELVCIHPVTGHEIRRTGAASIIIMVDRVPDGVVGSERNQWALNPSNKKSNALDMAFPKLKTECLKNAAQSLGKVFGRDLNRKNKDEYRPYKIATSGELPQNIINKLEVGIMNRDPQAIEAMAALESHLSPSQKIQLTELIQKQNEQ